MAESKTAVWIVAIVAVFVLTALVFGKGLTGAAVTNSGQAKTDNTPCARGCTIECTPGASLPAPGAEELSIHDCILQCMNARCGQTARAGKCDAFAKDDCCNIFSDGTDPDCVTCQPAGVCVANPGSCCSGNAPYDYTCSAPNFYKCL